VHVAVVAAAAGSQHDFPPEVEEISEHQGEKQQNADQTDSSSQSQISVRMLGAKIFTVGETNLTSAVGMRIIQAHKYQLRRQRARRKVSVNES
jgi:hypothetical protein